MMTDPVADMLARIRNASLAHVDRALVPLSKLKKSIAEILKSEGYIEDYRVDASHPPTLTILLKYGRDHEGRTRASAIAGLKRRSRPGRRVYVGHGDIPAVHNGMGVAILSTSNGLMTDKEARRRGIGGEVVCEVW